MEKWIDKIAIILCFFAVASCSDDGLNTGTDSPSGGADNYVGAYDVVTLKESMNGFRYANFVCEITSEDGDELRREGRHVRIDGQSELHFNIGLRPGIYRLQRLLAPEVDPVSNDTTWVEYGLGCRIQLGGNAENVVLDEYNVELGLFGKGTKDDPYIISSADGLRALRDFTNDDTTNRQLTESTHFKQTAAIDMRRASFKAGGDMGWLPIGNLNNNPFRGVYDGQNYSITRLHIDRTSDNVSFGLGLFGFAEGAIFQNMVFESASINGCIGVGSLLGCAVEVGDRRATVSISNCHVKNSTINSATGCLGAGGLVGLVDMGVDILLSNCTNSGTSVTGDYCVGGLIGGGGKTSRTYLTDCTNDGTILANYTGAGGIAGSVDSLMVTGASNTGQVTGAAKFTAYSDNDAQNGCLGAGGIAGGSGTALVVGCSNTATITGHTGVGGIIGSTRICRDNELGSVFNDLCTQSCFNEGNVTGKTSVGGIVGEAQYGCFSVYNSGQIEATDKTGNVGGIAGSTSMATLYKAVNNGTVKGDNVNAAGGVIGKAVWGNLYACENIGSVDVKAKYAGGVVGLAGNYTVMDYCANLNSVINKYNGSSTGGVVGEIGDPRKWSGEEIATCVLGCGEIVLGIATPFVAWLGSAVKTAEWARFANFYHYLHIGEAFVDGGLLAADTGFGFIWGSIEVSMEVELGVSEAKLQEIIDYSKSQVEQKVKTAHSEIDVNAIFDSELADTPLTDYLKNTVETCESYEESKEVAQNVNYHMNKSREERYKNIHHSKKSSGITHKIVAGVCVVGGTIAFIASLVATGGADAPIAPVVASALITTAGGLNAVTESAMNYQDNVVIVSQCTNIGPVTGDHADQQGGLIGNVQQSCYISDCLNAGSYKNSAKAKNCAGLFGHISHGCQVKNCLNVGSKWTNPIADWDYCYDYSHVYYYDKDADPEAIGTSKSGVPLDKLCDPNTYKGWDLENSVWTVTNTQGCFPVPKKSVMQKPVNENVNE